MNGEFDSAPLSFEEIRSQEPIETVEAPKQPRFRHLGLFILGFLFFTFFLLMKLPDARIQNFVVAHIKIITQQQGLSFNAERVKTSFIFGPSLKFYNIELKALDNEQQTLKISYLKIRPHLFSLLPFVKAKTVSISSELLDGSISGSVGAGQTATEIDLKISDININKTTLLRKFSPIEISNGIINGRVDVSTDSLLPAKTNGSIKLNIEKLGLPPQSIYGFNLPKLGISDTKIEVTLGDGKMNIRAAEVGKDLKTDDIVARITGDGTIDATSRYAPTFLDRIRLNAKATFQLSPAIIQSFPLLDSLLQPSKTADGKYAYKLNGSLMMPEAIPSP